MKSAVQIRHGFTSQRLRMLAAGLHGAGPTVLAEACKTIQARVDRIVQDKLPPHERTGYAASIVVVELDDRGVRLKQPRYLRLQGESKKARASRLAEGGGEKRRKNWWPFKSGFPLTIKNQFVKIATETLKKLLEP
jgi:hypothetical protein